jgi:2'-5' RNA ligase
MAVRTFLALDLDDGIRQRLTDAARELSDPAAKIRWVAEQNLHVTLKFLGDIPDERVAEVCSLAAEAASHVEPFDFDVKGIVCVPARKGQLRMLWVGVEEPTGRMADLHTELELAMSSVGVAQENRAFKPHVTLARVKFIPGVARFREAASAFARTPFGTQHARQLAVYSSELTPRGAIYTSLAKACLGGEG